VEHERGDDRFATLEERFSGYEVHDSTGENIGEVDLILVDESGRPEYVGMKTGRAGSRFPLIPLEAVRVDEGRRVIEVPPLSKGRVEDGPSYDDGQQITPEFEQEVRRYYDLEDARDGYRVDGGYTSEPAARSGGERESSLGDAGETRIQRSEEEARAGTRAREAGAMKIRKSVRTEREQVRVPKRREEVDIEWVPGEGREATGAEIGEEEVVIQVFEEEVVVSKRTVLKEEIRIRKKVVVEEEVIEVDLRKEEIDIVDTTGRSAGQGTDGGQGTNLDGEAGRRES